MKLEAKKYKTRYDWVRKIVHKEFCKRLKVDHTNKYAHRRKCPKNESHVTFRDFEMEMDHPIPARIPDQVLIIKKKRTCLFYFNRLRSENKRKRNDKEILGSFFARGWRRCEAWCWQCYQLKFVRVEWSLTTWDGDCMNCKSENWYNIDQSIYCWDQQEYLEDSWRAEGTCCYSNSSERPVLKTGVKDSQSLKW